jgi:hypothetical protein
VLTMRRFMSSCGIVNCANKVVSSPHDFGGIPIGWLPINARADRSSTVVRAKLQFGTGSVGCGLVFVAQLPAAFDRGKVSSSSPACCGT